MSADEAKKVLLILADVCSRDAVAVVPAFLQFLRSFPQFDKLAAEIFTNEIEPRKKV